MSEEKRRWPGLVLAGTTAAAALGVAYYWWHSSSPSPSTSSQSGSSSAALAEGERDGGKTVLQRLSGKHAQAEAAQHRREELNRLRLQHYFDSLVQAAGEAAVRGSRPLAAALRTALPVPSKTELRAALSDSQSSNSGGGGGDAQSGSTNVSSTSASSSSSAGVSKVELWHRMVAQWASRMLSAVYSLAALTLFARMQASVLGQNVYLDELQKEQLQGQEVDGLAEPLREEAKRGYLDLQDYFCRSGVAVVAAQVAPKVVAVLGEFPLERTLSFSEVANMFATIHRAMLEDIAVIAQEALLPSESEQVGPLSSSGVVADEQVQLLVNHTRDVLESDGFRETLVALVSETYDTALGEVARHYRSKSEAAAAGESGTTEESAVEVALSLSHLIPAFQRSVTTLCATPNTSNSGDVTSASAESSVTSTAEILADSPVDRLFHMREASDFAFRVFHEQLVEEGL